MRYAERPVRSQSSSPKFVHDLDMQRNWDVIRAMLNAIEAHPRFHPSAPFEPSSLTTVFDGQLSVEVTSYHLTLLNEAGLLHTVRRDHSNSVRTLNGHFQWGVGDVLGLSWEGHEFLDTIRDDTVWSRTKAKLIQGGAAFTYDLIKSVAVSFVRSHLGA